MKRTDYQPSTDSALMMEFADRFGASQLDEGDQRPAPRAVEQRTILDLAHQLRQAGALPLVNGDQSAPGGWPGRWSASKD